MSHRRLRKTPPGIALGPLDQIEDGKARSFVVQLTEGRFHGFIVRQGASISAYVDSCPHAGAPLARELDDYLTPDGELIACWLHGAVFRIDDGECLGGPCMGQKLSVWPVDLREGALVTG